MSREKTNEVRNFYSFHIIKKKTKQSKTKLLYVPELSVAAELCSVCKTSEKAFRKHRSVYNVMSEELIRNTFCIK